MARIATGCTRPLTSAEAEHLEEGVKAGVGRSSVELLEAKGGKGGDGSGSEDSLDWKPTPAPAAAKKGRKMSIGGS